MKKIISTLAAGLIFVTAPLSVISCNNNSSSKIIPSDAQIINNIINEENSGVTFNNNSNNQKDINYVDKYNDLNVSKVSAVVMSDLQISSFFKQYQLFNESYKSNDPDITNSSQSAGTFTFSVINTQSKKVLIYLGQKTFTIPVYSNDFSNYNQVNKLFANFKNQINNNSNISYSNISLLQIINSIGFIFGISNLSQLIISQIDVSDTVKGILSFVLNQKLSWLLNFLVQEINSQSDSQGIKKIINDLSNITFTNLTPDLKSTTSSDNQNWNNFCNDLSQLIANILNEYGLSVNIDFNKIGFSDFSKSFNFQFSFTELGMQFKIAIDPTLNINGQNLQGILNAIAPDIIHFFDFAEMLSKSHHPINYSLAVIQYLVNSPTVKFSANDNFANYINTDLINSQSNPTGLIKSNLDNFLFDLCGSVITKNTEGDNVYNGWHIIINNSNVYAPPAIVLSCVINTNIFGSKGVININYGYLNSYFSVNNGQGQKPYIFISKTLINITNLFQDFWSINFFNINYLPNKDFPSFNFLGLNYIDYTTLLNVLWQLFPIAKSIVTDGEYIYDSIYSMLDKIEPNLNFSKNSGLSSVYIYKYILVSSGIFGNTKNINRYSQNNLTFSSLSANLEFYNNNQWITPTSQSDFWKDFLSLNTTNFRLEIDNLNLNYKVNGNSKLNVPLNLKKIYIC